MINTLVESLTKILTYFSLKLSGINKLTLALGIVNDSIRFH